MAGALTRRLARLEHLQRAEWRSRYGLTEAEEAEAAEYLHGLVDRANRAEGFARQGPASGMTLSEFRAEVAWLGDFPRDLVGELERYDGEDREEPLVWARYAAAHVEEVGREGETRWGGALASVPPS